MQKQLLFIPMMFIVFIANAININDSKVTEVTVFRNYAKETRIGSIGLQPGNNEIIISNVSLYMDENSIQVATKGTVKILSVSTRTNYLTDKKKSEQILKLNDSVEILNDDVSWMREQTKAFQDELKLLDDNSILSNDKNTFTSAQVKELAELYRVRSIELRKFIFDLAKKQKTSNEKIVRIQQQVAELNGNQNTAMKEIVLKVNASASTQATFKCSYIVTNAYWTPIYDIRAKNVNEPLHLDCRAKVVQNTGYDWKDVQLKLSTANPSANHNRPILYPIYVDFFQPDYYSLKLKKSAAPVMQMMENKSSNMAYISGGLEDKVAEDMAVEYTIATVQDVESDNQEHIVGIQEIEMPAIYNYHTVPKLDLNAYLLARVTNWAKYNLLAGEANIFFDDNYVGKSYLNPNVSSDTLLISLGRDEKISVKRMKLNDFSSKKLFGQNIKETKVFETTIKNNKNTAIEIEVLDQYPISRNSQIEVSTDDLKDAQVTEEYGKLIWKFKLQPNETRKIKLSYTIKYPKDKQVSEGN